MYYNAILQDLFILGIYICGVVCPGCSVLLGAQCCCMLSAATCSVLLGAWCCWVLSVAGYSVLLGAQCCWVLSAAGCLVLLGAQCCWFSFRYRNLLQKSFLLQFDFFLLFVTEALSTVFSLKYKSLFQN